MLALLDKAHLILAREKDPEPLGMEHQGSWAGILFYQKFNRPPQLLKKSKENA